MPYTGPDDEKLPDNVKALSAKKRRQWVAVFNGAYERCQADGGTDCESSAFAQANGVVFAQEQDMPGFRQLCPYEDCAHDLSFENGLDRWYKCGACERLIYARNSDHDYEDLTCYTEDSGRKFYSEPPDEELPTAVDKGESYATKAYQQRMDEQGKGSRRTYTPPKAAQDNAKRVLRWRDEHPDEIKGMTQVGWTRANQLAKGENLSLDTIKRMSQFARHRQNATIAPEHEGTPWKDAGYVAWLGWGGDEGIAWAQRVVKQEEEKQEAENMPGFDSLTIAVGDKTLTLAELVRFYEQAVATKKVGDRVHDRGDFLVVEDPEKVTTWHLPVKIKGTPDRGLAGAAWAALFNPRGYRGQPYEGPGKEEAGRKLRALYRAEEWPMPDEEGEAEEQDGVDIEQVKGKVQDLIDFVQGNFPDDYVSAMLNGALMYLLDNITFHPEEPGPEPPADDEEPEMPEEAEEPTEPEPPTEPEEAEAEAAEFAESAIGHAVSIVEADGAPKSKRDPLLLDVVLIQPGPGNATDNHYYPAEMLRRDAGIFEGAKMYTSDHRQSEKSVRNEVSVVKEIKGFTDDGAPLARVAIHDPDFAEMARNRAELGTLETLECSILASGKAHVGEIDGKEYKIVDHITEAKSVDWVTRAGAGGRAHSIAESDEPREEGITPDNDEDADVQEGDATETVAIAEESAAPAPLAEAEVMEILAASNLPPVTIKMLSRATYTDADELHTAVAEQHELLKSAGSGKPFGAGKPTTARPTLSVEEINERKNKVNEKYGF